MITVYYFLDNRAAYKSSKQVPLIADVKYDHSGQPQHFRFSTGIKCNKKLFRSQEIRSAEPNAESKNERLKRIRRIVEGIYLEGTNKGTLPDPDTFRERIRQDLNTATTERTTLDHLQDYIDHIAAKKKSKSFISAIQKIREALIELRDKGVSIRLEDINLPFETKYRKLLNDRGYGVNTVSAYIKRLKMFLNWAWKNNLHQNQIYKLFEMEEEAREIVALEELEVETIAGLNIPSHKHITTGGTKLVRDWLIISTQTALRFSDFPKVAEPKLVKVTDGFDLHVNRTQKTKEKVVIPVSRLLYRIFQEHDFNVPLPPSNQKYNAGLKRIAGLAKLKKEISSHTGRKTFATINYKRGVPVPQIMKITGHRTEKEFYKYIGVSLSENAAMVRETSKDFQFEHEPVMKAS